MEVIPLTLSPRLTVPHNVSQSRGTPVPRTRKRSHRHQCMASVVLEGHLGQCVILKALFKLGRWDYARS